MLVEIISKKNDFHIALFLKIFQNFYDCTILDLGVIKLHNVIF